MRTKLEYQADRIEAVLKLHKIEARVTGGTVTPRWVRFKVTPAIGEKISRIKAMSEELAAALDTTSCRINRRGATVDVEIARDDPQPVRLLPLYKQLQEGGERAIPPVTAVIGLAEDGAPLLIRLPSPDVAHVLIAGTTGSGKTMLLQVMALSLAMTNRPPSRWSTGGPSHPAECGFVMIDPKGNAFRTMRDLPHLVRPVIAEMDDAVEALHSLVRLMEQRTNPIRQDPRIIVMIDELADILMQGGKEVQTAITRLTQRGRESGIHIVAATQKPTSAVLGPLVKANFPVRLVGRVMSVEDARTATGWSGSGAERLAGRGDFLAVAEGQVIRFQVAHVSSDEMHDVVEKIRGKSASRKPPPRGQRRAQSTTPPPSSPTSPTGLRHAVDNLKAIFAPIARPAVETPFLVDPSGPQVVDAKVEEVTPPLLEPEEVLPPVEPPEKKATLPTGKVAEYTRRLTEMEWDASQSYRAACRALGVSEGGTPFQNVREAVSQMRNETDRKEADHPKGMACARQAIEFVEPNGDEPAATASAIPEESPTPPRLDTEGPLSRDSGRAIALESQDDSDDTHWIDEGKLVSIGLPAEVRWDHTPQTQAIKILDELRQCVGIEGEDAILVTAILVDMIRADRMTAWVKLV